MCVRYELHLFPVINDSEVAFHLFQQPTCFAVSSKNVGIYPCLNESRSLHPELCLLGDLSSHTIRKLSHLRAITYNACIANTKKGEVAGVKWRYLHAGWKYLTPATFLLTPTTFEMSIIVYLCFLA